MGDYGVKIKNIAAGSLYGYNLGIRNTLDSKDALLPNSLFLDYMKNHGLNIYKGVSTRDVIGLDFNYGCRSYEEEIKHLQQCIRNISKDPKATNANKIKRLKTYIELMIFADKNKHLYRKTSKQDIRTDYYVNGVTISYPIHDQDGSVIGTDDIHYRMLYRTPGKAKKGMVNFIRDELYDVARDYLYMGIELPYENSPIVEIGAYSSLVTSSTIGNIEVDHITY